jgi:hypothetical protein
MKATWKRSNESSQLATGTLDQRSRCKTDRPPPAACATVGELAGCAKEAQGDLMDNQAGLSVRVAKSGKNYHWEIYRDGIAQKVKYSAPIYITEESAMAAGCEARALYLVRLERSRKPR